MICSIINCGLLLIPWLSGVSNASHAPQFNWCQITNLLVVDALSSLHGLPYDDPPLPVACKLPIKTMVARQLPTTIVNRPR